MKHFTVIAALLFALPLVVLGQPGEDAPKADIEKVIQMGPGHGPMCGPGGAPAAMQCGPMGGPGGMECCGKGRGMKGRGGHGPGMDMLFRMADELELTADQKAKLEKMRTDFKLAVIDQQAKIKKTRVLLGDLRRDDKAAAGAVEAKIDEMARLRAEMAKMKYRHHSAIKAVLTDKQKDMIKKKMEQGPMKRIKEIRIMEGKAPHGMEG
ncbi:MAG: periplasmic heavy metal sensor [candidate division Zixibacteria bacterium]|nr:periplasmic heavy metal sensor [candidate division Zixibacteria bacterium]